MSEKEFIHRFKRFVPGFVRAYLRRNIPLTDYDLYQRQLANPLADHIEKTFPDCPVRIGILAEFYQYHQTFVSACEELSVSYKVIDISGPEWIDKIMSSGCDAFLVWPSSGTTIWKQMYDDKLYIMEKELGLLIYPSWREVWVYENKRRTCEWLKSRNIPHPNTWIFYTQSAALDFIKHASLPIVLKSNTGSTASGVFILRDRRSAIKKIKQAFKTGIVPRGYNPGDKQWGFVYLQEYIKNAQEWRMIRIGDSYFGYRKEKVGDFHSGSHTWSWLEPPRALLDFLKSVTEAGGFTSMDVDVFVTEDGTLMVNELQTVFGASTPADMLRINNKPGRFVYQPAGDLWIFEEGDFSRNMCSNERVLYLFGKLMKLSPA